MAQAVLSLSNVSANNTLGTFTDQHAVRPGGPASTHLLLVTAATGVTGGVVALVGSFDTVNWVPLSSGSITTSAAGSSYVTVSNTPFLYVAAKITTVISGGSSPSVSAWVASV